MRWNFFHITVMRQPFEPAAPWSAPVAMHGVHHVFHPALVLIALTDDGLRARIVFITRGPEPAIAAHV